GQSVLLTLCRTCCSGLWEPFPSDPEDCVGSQPVLRRVVELAAEDLGHVDHDLSVLGEADLEPLQRARRGTLEVDAGDVGRALRRIDAAEARSVTRALELVLGLEEAGRAAEVGALAEDHHETVAEAGDPDAVVLDP